MKVSIIVTTYNRAEVLRDTLPSALQQDFDKKEYEVIVVDDASEDGTKDVVSQYCRARYVRHDMNKGLAAARNTGVRHARGQYVVFMDDDDRLVFNFLSLTVPVLDASPQYHAIGGGRNVFYPNPTPGKAPQCIYDPPVRINADTFYVSMDDGFLIRKTVFHDILYDEELLTDEDADFGLQFLKKYKIKMLDTALLFKKGHAVSMQKVSSAFSFSYPSERRYVGLRRFLKKNLGFFRQKGGREYAYICRMAGRTFCWGGKMAEGRPLLWRAFKQKPDLRNMANCIASLCGSTVYRWYWALESRFTRAIRERISPA